MLKLLKNAKKELCARVISPPALASLILCLCLMGCSARPHLQNEATDLAPRSNVSAEEVLHRTAGPTAIGVLSIKDYKSLIQAEDMAVRIQDPKQQKAFREKIKSGLLQCVRPFLGDQNGLKRVKADINKATERFSKPDENVGPGIQPLNDEGAPTAFLVLDNPDQILKAGAFEKTVLESMTGIKGLDQALGEEHADKIHRIVLYHELTHAGDPVQRQERLAVKNADNKILPPSLVNAGEIRADLGAVKAFLETKDDVEVLKDWMFARAMNLARNGPQDHETAFALLDVLKKNDPSLADLPSVEAEKIPAAFEKLQVSLRNNVKDILAETAASHKDSSVLNSLAIVLKKGKITDPDARALAQIAVRGASHFEERMQDSAKPELASRPFGQTRSAAFKKQL